MLPMTPEPLEVVWCQGWETAGVKAQQCAPPPAKDGRAPTSAPMPAVVRGRVMSFLRRHQATASQAAICRAVGLPSVAVSQALYVLVQRGVIEKLAQGQGRQSSVYRAVRKAQ